MCAPDGFFNFLSFLSGTMIIDTPGVSCISNVLFLKNLQLMVYIQLSVRQVLFKFSKSRTSNGARKAVCIRAVFAQKTPVFTCKNQYKCFRAIKKRFFLLIISDIPLAAKRCQNTNNRIPLLSFPNLRQRSQKSD